MTPRHDVEVDVARDAGSDLPQPLKAMWRTVYWTYERATWQYDLMVVAILAFVWLTPPSWIGDPHAADGGPVAWLVSLIRG